MTSQVLWANNAGTTLAASITSTATTISVVSGTGSLFPNPGSNQFFALTLISAASSSTFEIVYCTARSSDTLTVTRGQEGTSAKSFNAGDYANQLQTAGALNLLPQIGEANVWSNNNTFTATPTFTMGMLSNGLDAGGAQLRVASSNYGALIRNDNTSTYFLLTNYNNPNGGFNSLRPITVVNASGAVQLDGTGAGVSTGGSLSVAGSLAVSNGGTVAGGLSASGGVTISNGLSASGGLTVNGAASMNSQLSVAGLLTASGGIAFSGGGTISGIVTAPTASLNTSSNQLATTAFCNPQSVVAQTGMVQFPCGTIMMWSYYNLPTGNGDVVTLPYAFPNSIYRVIASASATANYAFGWAPNGSSLSSFLGWSKGIATSGSGGMTYLAIGS